LRSQRRTVECATALSEISSSGALSFLQLSESLILARPRVHRVLLKRWHVKNVETRHVTISVKATSRRVVLGVWISQTPRNEPRVLRDCGLMDIRLTERIQ
jgi:hypothetical protein